MTVMMMPTGMIAIEIGVVPGIIPQMAIEAAPMMCPMMSIVPTPMMVPMTAPRTPTKGIAHPIVPIEPIAGCREHIGIQPIVINIPIPTGPQGTAIYNIPVERTAHGDSIAWIAETDDAHGILIVRVTTVKTVDPTLILVHASKL